MLLRNFKPKSSLFLQVKKFVKCSWSHYFQGLNQAFMIINSILFERIQFCVGNFITARSCVITHNTLRRFKSVYKFDMAKKLLGKFKRQRELELYKSRIITVPNVLTISRLTLSPLFPLLITNGHSNYALGLLIYCGASDIVLRNCYNWSVFKFLCSLMVGSREDSIKNQ